MTGGEEKNGKQGREFLPGLVNMLARLAGEKSYGPLDALATAPSIQTALPAIYNAVRYAITQGYPVPSEEELNTFIAMARRDPSIMREIAIKALIKTVRQG
jgi:hypothetical protein